MSETAAKFDMCTICRDILKLNGPVHLDPTGIIVDGELESIGPFDFPVLSLAPQRSAGRFPPYHPYAGSGNAN